MEQNPTPSKSTMAWEAPPLSSLQATLADPQTPVGMRMRATYFLRQEYDNYTKKLEFDDTTDTNDGKKNLDDDDDDDNDVSLAVINTLSKCLDENCHGSLLRHEFAYGEFLMIEIG